MRRRKALHSIQRLAEHGADAASRDVGMRLRSLQAEEERLRQVRGYLDHYEHLSVAGSAALTLGALQGRRQFAARLREAADRQAQVVEDYRVQYLRQVEHWRAARSRSLGLQRFNERIRQHETDRLERREQAALDEIAQRRR
ncbi:MAG: flagellar FliJ family protein [Gammaproteobacteria bacterium]|nr:MAG: flagellar FliJ family protein [Gammaproteobacteria bacterium]